ncbi:heat shock protein 23-like [Musca vetustissima]|uniref:heat shock protein 23-like n=1 Tax=Musca vetustissima TaxID=27455 RepID=UPI002AB77FC1|nr:heat shock protein 23-like [Musca vetustissima]
MSTLPLLLSLIDELDRESPSYYGNDFGLGLSPYLIHSHAHREPITNSVGYTMPLSLLSRLSERQAARRRDSKEDRISPIGKDGFQVCLDVAQFKPNELNVKVVDNSIVIEGKHEEREDQHGYIQRHFVRRYVLPNGYDAEKVASTLSSDGILTVSVPKPQIEDKSNERVVQIQQTGPAHLNIKQNSKEKGTETNGTATNGAAEEEKK